MVSFICFVGSFGQKSISIIDVIIELEILWFVLLMINAIVLQYVFASDLVSAGPLAGNVFVYFFIGLS